MKFAHEFNEALGREGFPKSWVESAIPYSQLKKCLKKVQQELENLGLAPETLRELARQSDKEPTSPTAPIDRRGSNTGYEYNFDDAGTKALPKLTLFIQLVDGVAVDAALAPATKKYLSDLALKQQDRPISSEGDASENSGYEICNVIHDLPDNAPGFRRIEVPLTFDAEFFDILYEDVTALDNLQAEEEKALSAEIEALSTDLRLLAKPPAKFQKSDLNRWRELFDIYLQAGIFFSTQELDHGHRDSAKATQQLQWFQTQVTQRKIVETFKLRESRQALKRFMDINITLLQSLKFQEINQKAISKILKKFDKRTNLGARKSFPKLIQSDSIVTGSMAQAVCSQVNQDLIQLVPQLEDNKCPICLSVVWRPIRMRCKHVLCIGCTIQLQKTHKKLCPLCREPVIMEADTDNIDQDLSNYLKKYFPKEVREKQIQYEIEDGIERFGPSYKHPSQSKSAQCHIM